MIIAKLLILFFLFILLAKSADLTIKGISTISKDINLPIIFSGIILGFFTSLPEFFIGINATINNIGQVSYGNLMGGIIVLFGLVTGLSVILNKEIEIKNNFQAKEFVIITVFLFLPIFAAFFGRGVISQAEGLIMIFCYIAVVLTVFAKKIKNQSVIFKFFPHHRKMVLYICLGMVGVIVLSKFIVDITLYITSTYQIPAFLVGLIIFSIGTNLPELVLVVRAWQKKIKEMSVGNVIGAAITHVLIIGILSFLKPIKINISPSFLFFSLFYFFICIVYAILAITDKKFNQKEGLVLLGAYIFFIISQIFVEKIWQ